MNDLAVKNFFVLVTLFLLIIIPNFAIDIHVPAMPVMVKQLAISISTVQLTMSVFLLSYCISPLFFGILSDTFGRKKIVLIALFILSLGGVVCAVATSAAVLLMGRFIQGIGAAGCICISRALMRDSYQGHAMARVASFLGIAIELSLAFSPALGGYLVHTYGWRSNFAFLMVFALLIFLYILFFQPETNQQHHRDFLKLKSMIENAKFVLKSKVFFRYLICNTAAFSSGIAFFTISPFIIQIDLHYSAKFNGNITLLVTGAVVIGAIVNACCIKKMGCISMIKIGLIMLFLSGIVLLLFSLLLPLKLFYFIVPSSLAFFALAFLFGNCMSGALGPFSKQAGIASAVYSFIQVFSAVMVTSIISILHYNSGEFLSVIFLVMSSLAMFSFWMLA